jgi:C4-type Zn-finger protein
LSRQREDATVNTFMPETQECPLCGGTMRLKTTNTVARIPGNPSDTTLPSAEWVCPDCDYYEEAEGTTDRKN